MTDSPDNTDEPVKLEDIRFKIPNIKYELVNTYPHDPSAFTEGLVFYKNTFYESTGRYPQPYPISTLRQVEIKTGRILRVQVLRSQYFAEGLTIFQGKIFLLTYRHHKGFVYDLDTLNLLDAFCYEGEGWGLTNDGKSLIMSNGTHQLQLIEPERLEVLKGSTINVHVGGHPFPYLNELEYIDGSIYANVLDRDVIVRINPKDGAVTGLIDLSDLRPPKTEGVLNGIAYDKFYERLFITGKYWPR